MNGEFILVVFYIWRVNSKCSALGSRGQVTLAESLSLAKSWEWFSYTRASVEHKLHVGCSDNIYSWETQRKKCSETTLHRGTNDAYDTYNMCTCLDSYLRDMDAWLFATGRQGRGDSHKQPSQANPPSLVCIRMSSHLARYENVSNMSVSIIFIHTYTISTCTSVWWYREGVHDILVIISWYVSTVTTENTHSTVRSSCVGQCSIVGLHGKD